MGKEETSKSGKMLDSWVIWFLKYVQTAEGTRGERSWDVRNEQDKKVNKNLFLSSVLLPQSYTAQAYTFC